MLHLILFIIAQLLDFNLDKKKSLRKTQFTIYILLHVLWCVLECAYIRNKCESLKRKVACKVGKVRCIQFIINCAVFKVLGVV